jgi:hypothetical protein
MSVKLPINIYHEIIKHKTKVKYKLRIDKIPLSIKENSKKSKVIDDTFVTYMDDNIGFIDKNLNDMKEKKKGKYDPDDFKNVVDLYLFKENDLLASKTTVNSIIQSANMTTALCYLFTKAKFKKVLMTPLDNKKTYKEIPILYTSVLKNILRLDEVYGFYNHGKLMFFDFDVLYFINKRGNCTAYRKGEYKEVIIRCRKSSDANAKISGGFKDTKKKTYTINTNVDLLNIQSLGMIDDQISGNKIVTISPTDNKMKTTSAKTSIRGKDKEIIMVDQYNNTFTTKEITHRKMENDSIISMTSKNIDISVMTPNKKFTFKFDEISTQKKIGGTYRLCKFACEFEKTGEGFAVNSVSLFKKIK